MKYILSHWNSNEIIGPKFLKINIPNICNGQYQFCTFLLNEQTETINCILALSLQK